jgi:hypothetical protein
MNLLYWVLVICSVGADSASFFIRYILSIYQGMSAPLLVFDVFLSTAAICLWRPTVTDCSGDDTSATLFSLILILRLQDGQVAYIKNRPPYDHLYPQSLWGH